jgi:hypothetical protein
MPRLLTARCAVLEKQLNFPEKAPPGQLIVI